MKETLVVGGAGFIGSHLIPKLKLRGQSVINVDSMLERVHGAPFNPPEGVFFEIDSRDAEKMAQILNGREIGEVYFLASDTSTGSSLHEVDSHVSQNTTALAGLLKALSQNNQTPERIVLTSSRAVYGEGHEKDSFGHIYPLRSRTLEELDSQKWAANRQPNCEFVPNHYLNRPNPTNVYGLTKLFQEELLGIWCKANGVPYNVYRLQNVIGPGQNPGNSYSGVVTFFCMQAILGNRLEIYEGGQIIRDFIHVDDVADALQIPLKQGYTHVDVGTGEAMLLKDMAQMISTICNLQEPIITDLYRIGDVGIAYADPNSLISLSQSWNPRKINREVLLDIVEYVRSTTDAN